MLDKMINFNSTQRISVESILSSELSQQIFQQLKWNFIQGIYKVEPCF